MKHLLPRILCFTFALAAFFASGALAQEHGEHGEHKEGGGDYDHAAMHGSTEDQQAVRATVDALFDAMRAADGSGVTGVFAEDARLMTAMNRDGKPMVNNTPIDRFAASVGSAAAGALDERIWNVMVHVNGNLATAWVPYAFYHNEKFSHCGVNAMQLVKAEGGWKILQLTDTRQREGCDIPEDVGKM